MDPLEAKVARLSSWHLFPKIYAAAHLALALCPDNPTFSRFTSQFVSTLKKSKLTAHLDKNASGQILIDEVILLRVISEQDNLEQTAKALREHLKTTGFPLVGYVLQFGSRIRWKRVQVTERYSRSSTAPISDEKESPHRRRNPGAA
ncbi:hypothetical protein D6779_05145 [Candidatus Parcubacteria bacterium]|nr:MAG: hypothetical protein D6779_05145 [Candidatus Parcubacteria bacterium]